MSLVNESLDRRPSAGLSLRQKVEYGIPGADQDVISLLDRKPSSGLSAREWAKLGLESAEQTVQMVEELVAQKH